MRVEYLMIGDWVIAPNGKPCKVVSIEGVDACVLDENKSIVPLRGEVIGVSLTAEILEKNGFKKDEEDDSVFFYEDGVMTANYFVWVAILFGVGKVDIITNHNRNSHSYRSRVQKRLYVHELQHKLRDCELFDLANNFKV